MRRPRPSRRGTDRSACFCNSRAMTSRRRASLKNGWSNSRRGRERTASATPQRRTTSVASVRLCASQNHQNQPQTAPDSLCTPLYCSKEHCGQMNRKRLLRHSGASEAHVSLRPGCRITEAERSDSLPPPHHQPKRPSPAKRTALGESDCLVTCDGEGRWRRCPKRRGWRGKMAKR